MLAATSAQESVSVPAGGAAADDATTGGAGTTMKAMVAAASRPYLVGHSICTRRLHEVQIPVQVRRCLLW